MVIHVAVKDGHGKTLIMRDRRMRKVLVLFKWSTTAVDSLQKM